MLELFENTYNRIYTDGNWLSAASGLLTTGEAGDNQLSAATSYIKMDGSYIEILYVTIMFWEI